MVAANTKQWMTPKRLARGPAAANAELQRWSNTAFRPAKLYGDVRAMRADALASRRAGVGSSFVAREPRRRWLSAAETTLIGLSALGIGYLIGRWLRRRYDRRAPAVMAADVLGAL